jgi:hypothetical protein
MTARIPDPAYRNDAVLYGDKELYARIGKVAEGGLYEKKLVEQFEIPIRSGKAWVVKKGILTPLDDELRSVSVKDYMFEFHSNSFVSHFSPFDTSFSLSHRPNLYSVYTIRSPSRRSEHLLSSQSSGAILGFSNKTVTRISRLSW